MAENIQNISPAFGLPDDEEAAAVLAFWSEVAADPMVVVIVEPVFAEDEQLDMAICDVAVFTTYERAREHAEALQCHGAVIIPKRLDEPSWGNVAVN